MILSFIITSFTGVTLERIFHQKWKDYSRRRFNFGGYVNLPYTVVWGAAALLCIWIVNPFLSKIIGILPYGLGKVILIIAYVIIIIDFIGTVSGILSVHIRLARLGKLVLVEEVADNLQKAADYMGNGLTGWVLKHLEKTRKSTGNDWCICSRMWILQTVLAVLSWLFSWRYYRNYLLLVEDGHYHKPKQCSLWPI